MTKKRFGRRNFLRGMGGVAFSLPLLSSGIISRDARAETTTEGVTYPKRFIFMIHPNGVVPQSWFPTRGPSGEDTDFQLGESHAPLEPFKDKLLLLENVNLEVGNWDRAVGPGEPHQKGMGGILTGRTLNDGMFVGGDGSRAGWGSGQSIDHYLTERVAKDTPHPTLHIGVRADSHIGSEVRSRVSYTASNQPAPPLNDPVDVFNQLFTDTMTDAGAMDEIRRRRGSVLDTVGSQFDSVYKRAGYEDRLTLERHLKMVRDLESRLEADGSGIGGDCEPPDTPASLEVDSEDTMPQIATEHLDLVALALACDMTRFVTLQFSNAKNGLRYPWVDSLGDGHGLSHAGPSNATAAVELKARDRWHAQQAAYLLGKLAEIPEGDGTLLDNTVFMWCSEIAVGNTHSHRNLPILMAGSAGGYFKTGRFVSYGTERSTNDLLVNILNAFGQDVETYGDPQYCNGPLSGLT